MVIGPLAAGLLYELGGYFLIFTSTGILALVISPIVYYPLIKIRLAHINDRDEHSEQEDRLAHEKMEEEEALLPKEDRNITDSIEVPDKGLQPEKEKIQLWLLYKYRDFFFANLASFIFTAISYYKTGVSNLLLVGVHGVRNEDISWIALIYAPIYIGAAIIPRILMKKFKIRRRVIFIISLGVSGFFLMFATGDYGW